MDFAAGSRVHDVAGETARVLGIGASAASTPTDALSAYLTDRDVLLVPGSSSSCSSSSSTSCPH